MKVLSYGGGVQTTALLRMVLDGRFERPDAVIFADTQDEPKGVYETIVREKAVCEAAGIPFHVVTYGKLSEQLAVGQVRVPAFTDNGTSSGGMLLRSCTDKFKVVPIRRFMRAQGWNDVEMWLGMSTDEIQRVKASNVQWVTNRYPLVEMNLRRSDCEAYLREIGLSVTKSACVFCPYRSHAAWQDVLRVPEDWVAAVAYDEALRDARPGIQCFVHGSRTPLAKAVLEPAPSLFDDECEGYCGA